MDEIEYYDPSKILSKKDIDGEEPSIYMISSNRSAGKTTSILKLLLDDFKTDNKKFILLYRYTYELNASHSIFKDVLSFTEYGKKMSSSSNARGLFYELFLDDKSCGYAIALNNPDALKKYSPIFADVYNVLFDEYQTENGKYLSKEPEKLQSVLLTVARGGGFQSRKLRLFMLSNKVSIMNPYYITFGIHKRIRNDTKFLRGKGWIAEFNYNKSASTAIKNNSLFKAFEDSQYMHYSTEEVYLQDSSVFVQKPKGKSKYLATIIHDGVKYGLRDFYDDGITHVSRKIDNSCKNVITFKPSDHNQNTMMLNRYSFIFKYMREAFYNGFLRFDDIQAKNAIFDILAIDIYK